MNYNDIRKQRKLSHVERLRQNRSNRKAKDWVRWWFFNENFFERLDPEE